MKTRKPLFSVSIRDCRVDTFTSGGKGGQHQNRTRTGVRVTHVPSRAVGESRETRSQHTNKQRAFRRMGESKLFRFWAKREAQRLSGQMSIEERVERDMDPSNLRVDVKDGHGRWVREHAQ